MPTSFIDKLKRSAPAGRLLAAKVRRQSQRALPLIRPVRVDSHAPSQGISCVCVVRDETLRLPDFLRHYRRLGIRRFIFLDNGSIDHTRELILDQPDSDLYVTDASFKDARFGVLWANALIRTLLPGQWVLYADADEQLIYDGCEDHGLDRLIHHLEQAGRRSLPCMMLDMYGAGAIRDLVPAPSDRLFDLCPLYDGDGYSIGSPEATRWVQPRIVHHQGGPRERLFSTSAKRFRSDIAKTPLARWDADVVQIYSHALYPFALNFGHPTGCLAHFKLLGDFHERAIRAKTLNNHYSGSAEYRLYLERLEIEPDLSATYEASRQYLTSGSLVESGLMSEIDWNASH